MLGYAELLKSHIAKENNVLFRMADKVLTNTEQERLLLEFAMVENETKTGHSKDDYIDMVENLAGNYLI
jgi:hemerythrin-like domain-containing protein